MKSTTWEPCYETWTFDEGRYPVGGYSDFWLSDPYTIEVERLDPPVPCPDPSGCCGATGAGGAASGMRFAESLRRFPDAHARRHQHRGRAGLRLRRGRADYASREGSLDTGFGPGWSDADELPVLVGGVQNLVARFGAEQTVWFDAQEDGSYTARYGAKDTLVHDAVNHLFLLTLPDGTSFEFFDIEQTSHPQGGLYRWVQPGGATIEVTAWTESGESEASRGGIGQDHAHRAEAYLKRVFTYVSTDDGPNHVQTLTLSQYDANGSAWSNVRKLTYDYYGYGASLGLAGDLKTIVTQQWDATAEEWVGDDTNYFRYYTGTSRPTNSSGLSCPTLTRPSSPPTAIPTIPTTPNAGDSQSDPIANYTCFYYEYDADRRVSKRLVFGKSNETEDAVTLSTAHAAGSTAGIGRRSRPGLDGSTNTVYVNFRGQAILTDLADSAGRTTRSPITATMPTGDRC